MINNSSNSSQPEYTPYSERPETYIVPIVFLFIYITGIIGNGTLIYVMLKEKLLRTPSYMFILNLAFGDLLVIICTVPFVGTIYTFESWPFGLIVCKVSEFIRDVSNNVTVLTLCAMSIDRYRAAFSTTLRSNVRTYYTAGTSGNSGNVFCNILGCTSLCNLSSLRLFKTMVKFLRSPTGMVMSAIWAVSLLAAFPTGYTSFILEYPISNGGPGEIIKVCYPYPEELGNYYPKVVVACKCIFLYIIPTIIIGYCYVSIAIHLMYKAKSSLVCTNYGSSLPTTTAPSMTTNTISTTTTAAASKAATTTTTTTTTTTLTIKSPMNEVTSCEVPLICTSGQQVAIAREMTLLHMDKGTNGNSSSIMGMKAVQVSTVVPGTCARGGSLSEKSSSDEENTAYFHTARSKIEKVEKKFIATSCSSNGTCCPSSSSSPLCFFPSHPSSCASSRHSSPSSSDCSLKVSQVDTNSRKSSNLSMSKDCTCCCHLASFQLPCQGKTRVNIKATHDTSEAPLQETSTSTSTSTIQNSRQFLTHTPDPTQIPAKTITSQASIDAPGRISNSPALLPSDVATLPAVKGPGTVCCSKCRCELGEDKKHWHTVTLQMDQVDQGNTNSGIELFVQSPPPSAGSSMVNASKSKFNNLSRSYTINTVTNYYGDQGANVHEEDNEKKDQEEYSKGPRLSQVSVDEKFKCNWTFDRKNRNSKSSRSHGSNGRGQFISSLAKDKASYSEMKLVDPSGPRYLDKPSERKLLDESSSLRCIKSRLLHLSGRSLVGSIASGLGRGGGGGGNGGGSGGNNGGGGEGSVSGCLNGGKGSKGSTCEGVASSLPANSVLQKSRKKSQSRAKMILLLVVIFLICFFPNHLFMMWFYFYPDAGAYYNNFWHVWRIMAFCLTFLNSTLNPITLYLTSDQFKHLFNKYLLKCFSSDNVHEATSNSGDSSNVITNK